MKEQPSPINPAIRPARPDEAALLTALAKRSKAAWGYDVAFMAACDEALTLTSAQVSERPTFVLEDDGAVRGFYRLAPCDADSVELAALFVAPEAMRRGYGRLLLRHALGAAHVCGARRLMILADPNALPFYLAMGATQLDMRPSDAIVGRMLPWLELRVPHFRTLALQRAEPT